MAVHIRLKRIGKNPKKRPHFRLAVYDERQGRDSRFIEEVGYYNPVSGLAKVNRERIEYWVKNGAQVSPTIKSLFKKNQGLAQKEASNATDTKR